MRCTDCPRYQPSDTSVTTKDDLASLEAAKPERPQAGAVTMRCLDGKVNPHNWENAVTVSQVLGIRAICPLNDFKERLVQSRDVRPQRPR